MHASGDPASWTPGTATAPRAKAPRRPEPDDNTANDTHRLEYRAGAIRRLVTGWLHLGQDLVLVGVAGILLLAGLVVMIDTMRELYNAIAAQNMAEAIFYIVENALLALILAELVHTLLVSLGGGPLTMEPFLVIAIVGILRKMLLTTVLAPKPAEANSLVSPVVAELFLLGLLILVLGGALALARTRRA
jgi:uncharacterized membrane protein (DUF373 family)